LSYFKIIDCADYVGKKYSSAEEIIYVCKSQSIEINGIKTKTANA